jgi:hypothetical protein
MPTAATWIIITEHENVLGVLQAFICQTRDSEYKSGRGILTLLAGSELSEDKVYGRRNSLHATEKGGNSYFCLELNPTAYVFRPPV